MEKPRSSFSVAKAYDKTAKLNGSTSTGHLTKKSLNMSQRPAGPSSGYYVNEDLQKRIKKIRNI